MGDFFVLVNVMKTAALEAVESTKPVAVMFGTISEIEPLTVNVEQKITLSTAQLIMTKTFAENSPEIGNSVILLRQQGGQKFIIIDVIATEIGGEETNAPGE